MQCIINFFKFFFYHIENFILKSPNLQGSFYDFMWQMSTEIQARLSPSVIGRYSFAAKISNFDPSALREVFENIPENIFETLDSYDLTNRLGLAGFTVDETVVRREIRLNVPEIWASENVQILLFLTEKSTEKLQVKLKIREAIRSLSFDQTFPYFSLLRTAHENVTY